MGMLLGILIRRRWDEKSSRASFMALPTSLASAPTSAPKRHLATISRVKRIISAWTSIVWPSRQAFERALREGGHHLSVSCYSLTVEGRLGEPSLAPPELALAGQQPFAEQAAVSPEDFRLGEVAIVLDEHVLDQVRMREQVERLTHEAQPYYVPVLSSAARKEAQWVPRVLPQIITEEVSLGAGWTAQCAHRFVCS